MLCAAQIDATGAFRRNGHRNAADDLAATTGTSAWSAHQRLRTAKKLRERARTEEELRRGAISPEQAAITADADAADEETLLEVAKCRGMKGLREEADRLAAARLSEEDAMARYRRVHEERGFRSWTHDGALNFAGSMTLDDGARFMAGFEAERQRLFKQAHAEGRPESNAAYLLDALFNTVVGTAAQPARPKAAMTITADAAAIIRGHLMPGEKCEIDGFGPIPVTVARSLMVDADIHGVVFSGGDIRAVTSHKRHIPAAIRKALEARDPCCSVETCDQTKGLQIDHIWEFGKQGPTELDNLVRLCPAHHRLKTTLGWRITGPPGTRQWLPPPRE